MTSQPAVISPRPGDSLCVHSRGIRAMATSDVTVHLFLSDPIFTDRTATFQESYGNGGVGTLSRRSLSYLKTPFTVRDTRQSRVPTPAFQETTRPTLHLDAAIFGTFIAQLRAVPQEQRNSLFTIIDRLVYQYSPSDTLTALDYELGFGGAYSIYVSRSLARATTTATGTALMSDSTTLSITVPDSVTFTIKLTLNGVITDYEIKVWTNDAAFYAGYAVSQVITVVPPLDYSTLLTAPLVGTGANLFSAAATTTLLAQATMATSESQFDLSGMMTYQVKVYDTLGNIILVPFNILYMGRTPDRFAIRQAIKAQVLTSGFGTAQSWKARIPELFIDARFYIVPMWSNRTTRPDQIIYPSGINAVQALDNTKAVLAQVDGDYVHDHYELVSINYSAMLVSAVPHHLNQADMRSFMGLHPTYQNFATTDPNFAYMTQTTRTMATILNQILPVAAGITVDAFYQPAAEGMLAYIPFDVNSIEYAVVTEESYSNLLGTTL